MCTHMQDILRSVLLHTFRHARRERYMRVRVRGPYVLPFPAHLATWQFSFRDDRAGDRGNAVGGADSSGVGGIGVGSTRSSLSRSAKSNEIVRDEKSTVVTLPGAATALSVTGQTGSPSVPLWPLSEIARKERRSGLLTVPSPVP